MFADSLQRGSSCYNGLSHENLAEGNVWEWTADWYDPNYYANSPPSNPRGPEHSFDHTLRSSSFYNGADYVRCAERLVKITLISDYGIGFRVVVGSSPGS